MPPEQLTGSPFPKTGTPQERADWHRSNASPQERLAIAAHELGHYEMAKRAGVHPEGITIGHHPMDSRSPSGLFRGGDIDTGLTHSIDQWRQRGMSINDAGEKKRFLNGYLKSLYAGAVAEEIVTQKASESGEVDSAMAREWMRKVALSYDEMDQKESELKQDVRRELSEPETKHKLASAAQLLAEHHFDGRKHPPSTIDHYLNGGTRQSLPTEERK